MADDSFKGPDTPCYGSDMWFDLDLGSAEQFRRRAEATRICRDVCHVYEACLEWAMSTDSPLVGIVAGTTAADRQRANPQRTPRPDDDPIPCPTCHKPFLQFSGSRPRKACSAWCARTLWRRQNGASEATRPRLAACDGCGGGLPLGNRRWCSDECRNTYWSRVRVDPAYGTTA